MKSALSRVFSAASARSTRSLGLVSQPVARVAVRGGQVRLQSTAPDAPPNDSLLALKNSIRAKDFASAWKDYTCVASNRALLRQFSQADAGKLITLIIRNPEQSNKLIADLKDIGVEWSTAEFNAVLEKEASTFIYGEAIAFLELMRRHSAQPNIDTYTILVKNLSKTDPVGAKAIVDNEEPADQVPPDGVIYPTLAAGFLRIGDVDTAKAVLDEMVTCEVKPDRAALEALVNDLMSKGHMEIAEQVMNEILGPNGALPGFGSDGARA